MAGSSIMHVAVITASSIRRSREKLQKGVMTMDRYAFPAIFEADDDGRGYTVTFPDLPGCITEGATWEEAAAMAQEVSEGFLWGMERDGDEIPEPSNPMNINLPRGAIITIITAWMDLVRDVMANKSVSKNVTLPRWLSEAAEQAHINFSQLLQQALKDRLGIHERK